MSRAVAVDRVSRKGSRVGFRRKEFIEELQENTGQTVGVRP